MKLLILGSNALLNDVIKICKKKSITSIVIDYYTGTRAPAKKIADSYYNISTADTDKLLEIMDKEKIDGVFTGFDDFNPYIAAKICDEMNLPFWGTKKQLDIIINKKNFKNLCKEYEIPVINSYKETDLKEVKFPVIVKPVDSCGAKGITVCYEENRINGAIQKAHCESIGKDILIEEYITDGYDISAQYIVKNTKIILTDILDRCIIYNQEGHPPLPTAYTYPSRFIDDYIKKLDQKVKKMITQLGISNGMLFVQGFVSGNDIFLYEMGFRPGGGQHHNYLEKLYGINPLELMIDFALYGNMGDSNIEVFSPKFKNICCDLYILLNQGKIKNIEGIEEIKKIEDVINVTQIKYVGDEVTGIGSLGQLGIRIQLMSKSKQEAIKKIQLINETLKIESEENNNMIINNKNVIEWLRD